MKRAMRKAGFKTSTEIRIEDLERRALAEGIPMACLLAQTQDVPEGLINTFIERRVETSRIE